MRIGKTRARKGGRKNTTQLAQDLILALHLHPPPPAVHLASQVGYQLRDLLRADLLPLVTLAGITSVHQSHHHGHVGVFANAYVVVGIGGDGDRARAKPAVAGRCILGRDGLVVGNGGIDPTGRDARSVADAMDIRRGRAGYAARVRSRLLDGTLLLPRLLNILILAETAAMTRHAATAAHERQYVIRLCIHLRMKSVHGDAVMMLMLRRMRHGLLSHRLHWHGHQYRGIDRVVVVVAVAVATVVRCLEVGG